MLCKPPCPAEAKYVVAHLQLSLSRLKPSAKRLRVVSLSLYTPAGQIQLSWAHGNTDRALQGAPQTVHAVIAQAEVRLTTKDHAVEAGRGPKQDKDKTRRSKAKTMTEGVLTSNVDVDLVVVAGRVAHHIKNLQAGVNRLAKTLSSCQHSMSSSSQE